MSTQDAESRFGLPLSRRAAVVLGSTFAAVSGLFSSLGMLDAEAKNKNRKRRRRKNKKRKKGKGGFTVVAPDMTGAKEVPGPGDPLGEGSAECTIKGNEICCNFTFTTTTPNSEINGIHIHEGPPDEDGDIVVPFSTALTDNCAIADEGIAAQIKTNPEDFYVNIHTDAFPDGAVRDQLQEKA
jgi:hypothetical protein